VNGAHFVTRGERHLHSEENVKIVSRAIEGPNRGEAGIRNFFQAIDEAVTRFERQALARKGLFDREEALEAAGLSK
jgi:hypothetical protein